MPNNIPILDSSKAFLNEEKTLVSITHVNMPLLFELTLVHIISMEFTGFAVKWTWFLNLIGQLL